MGIQEKSKNNLGWIHFHGVLVILQLEKKNIKQEQRINKYL